MQRLGFYCPHTDLIALLPFSFTATQELSLLRQVLASIVLLS